MRYLILSDLHGNLQALRAVLEDAVREGYDAVICLGDLVGYGADPGPVMAETLALAPVAIIRGNHDKVCAGLESDLGFSDVARASVTWTRQRLTPAEVETLGHLARGPVVVDETFEICHGTPFDEDHYLFDEEDARRSARAMSTPLCFFGHTHVPGIFSTATDLGGQPQVKPEAPAVLPRVGRTLVNVGSVGQPRDGDPRAAYGIFDAEAHAIQFRRVAYDVKAAQKAIAAAGLPAWLALRLERGQ